MAISLLSYHFMFIILKILVCLIRKYWKMVSLFLFINFDQLKFYFLNVLILIDLKIMIK